MKSRFVPGLELAEGFFRDAVNPILEKHFPQIQHSTALIGAGSEVLGFDSEMSMDHHWGPRCQLFLTDADYESYRDQIWQTLSLHLPSNYLGFSTSFTEPNPADKGTQLLDSQNIGPVNHRVEIYTLCGFFSDYLGIHINQEIAASTWLALSSQKLRSIVGGRVFHDELGLQLVRKRLEWYPKDVWLYILASCWNRIGQEEHLMGRAGIVDDEVGSSIIGSRLVRDIMRLALYMERSYPPYPKWLGTAFRELRSSAALTPLLLDTIHSATWRQRETCLLPAMELLIKQHNGLGITDELPVETSAFWGRPFKVVWGGRIAKAIAERIEDSHLQKLAKVNPLGSVDLFSDSTDMIGNVSLIPRLEKLFDLRG